MVLPYTSIVDWAHAEKPNLDVFTLVTNADWTSQGDQGLEVTEESPIMEIAERQQEIGIQFCLHQLKSLIGSCNVFLGGESSPHCLTH